MLDFWGHPGSWHQNETGGGASWAFYYIGCIADISMPSSGVHFTPLRLTTAQYMPVIYRKYCFGHLNLILVIFLINFSHFLTGDLRTTNVNVYILHVRCVSVTVIKPYKNMEISD